MTNFNGQTAVITGGAQGIGLATAKRFINDGCEVMIWDIDKKLGMDAAKELNCHFLEVDQTDNKVVEQVTAETIKKLKKIDILVNNAGINPVFDRLENADDKLFNKIIDINVKAAFKLSNMVMKYMKENNSGSIINISSVEGHKPDKGLGVYSISKAAISMLTKSQAKEWGKYGIRSNAICPGLIKTKLSSALWQNEEMLEIWLKDLPIRKAAEPEEISGMAVYLASNASSYTTGETFNIDGGYMIN